MGVGSGSMGDAAETHGEVGSRPLESPGPGFSVDPWALAIRIRPYVFQSFIVGDRFTGFL